MDGHFSHAKVFIGTQSQKTMKVSLCCKTFFLLRPNVFVFWLRFFGENNFATLKKPTRKRFHLFSVPPIVSVSLSISRFQRQGNWPGEQSYTAGVISFSIHFLCYAHNSQWKRNLTLPQLSLLFQKNRCTKVAQKDRACRMNNDQPNKTDRTSNFPS